MSTYCNLNELGNNILKLKDIVMLKNIKHIVEETFLCPIGEENDIIFKELGINKRDFCKEHYGYDAPTGIWPSCENGDYAALTRVVKALFKIIEKESPAKKNGLLK